VQRRKHDRRVAVGDLLAEDGQELRGRRGQNLEGADRGPARPRIWVDRGLRKWRERRLVKRGVLGGSFRALVILADEADGGRRLGDDDRVGVSEQPRQDGQLRDRFLAHEADRAGGVPADPRVFGGRRLHEVVDRGLGVGPQQGDVVESEHGRVGILGGGQSGEKFVELRRLLGFVDGLLDHCRRLPDGGRAFGHGCWLGTARGDRGHQRGERDDERRRPHEMAPKSTELTFELFGP
jgi:hypothetical protein